MKDCVIRTDGLCKDYWMGKVRIPAIADVSLAIQEGEFSCLAGPSGSGKSTLLHICAGFDSPSGGNVEILGRRMSQMRDREISRFRNREIGFVFQTFNLVPVLTAEENILYPARIFRGRPDAEYLDELFRETGLHDKRRKKPNQLSGGERQRVAIARALVNRPSVVFADEPTANLDHKTGGAVIDLLKSLNRKWGTTFLFSSHDSLVMDKADRILRLFDGRLVGEGT